MPLLAVVMFLVAGAQPAPVTELAALLPRLVPVFALFLIAAVLLAKLLTASFALPPAHGRTLAFAFGTRNSFVVLPVALLLPDPFRLAALAILVQAVVELFGMLAYLAGLERIFPERGAATAARGE